MSFGHDMHIDTHKESRTLTITNVTCQVSGEMHFDDEVICDAVLCYYVTGFMETNKACCGSGRYGGDLTCLPLQKPCDNRNQYIFWDSYHPTQAVNAIIAQGCYTEAATGCYPISIRQLAQL